MDEKICYNNNKNNNILKNKLKCSKSIKGKFIDSSDTRRFE